jgi:tRNA(adenine34) deaminase
MDLAVDLAAEAFDSGNLPIGAAIMRAGEVIGVGGNGIWEPEHRLDQHAEIQALRAVSPDLWQFAPEMSLYTTLEPCLMCFGALMLHGMGRVVFEALDPNAGVSGLISQLPPYFDSRFSECSWVGPADQERCDPLFQRSLQLISDRRPGREEYTGAGCF